MTTPIVDFVENYVEKNPVRAHMPGHKGSGRYDFYKYDITEITHDLSLYDFEGPFKESIENATELFESGRTFYSAEGSSLSIKAMLFAAMLARDDKEYAGEKSDNQRNFDARENSCEFKKSSKYVLATENIHRSFLDAVSLLDLDVFFIRKENFEDCRCTYENPEVSSNSCGADYVTPEGLDEILSSLEEMPIGVYVTSPDYYGRMLDIRGLSRVCKKYDTWLLVDNAHGAYLSFLKEGIHPMQLGAAMCADSAHKTLSALTGAAYLHIGKGYEDIFSKYVIRGLKLFASTSPSFLISMSLDECNRILSDGYAEKLDETVRMISKIRKELSASGIRVLDGKFFEPLKLTVDLRSFAKEQSENSSIEETGFGTKNQNMISDRVVSFLNKKNIYPEYADNEYIVLMLSPYNKENDFYEIRDALLGIPVKQEIQEEKLSKDFSKKEGVYKIVKRNELPIREAMLSGTEIVPIDEALGRICGECSVSCPPAIPIAICGEKINGKMIKEFKFFDIKEIAVKRF